MKQQLEILVVTEVDHDKQTTHNGVYEAELRKRIAEVVKEVLGTPKVRTLTGFEYGGPV